MRRTKIKTDNVEQLMEIVRSLQRGEEPTQESIRESAERVSKTDAPMSDEPESDAQMMEKRTDTEADWDAKDDAFVRSAPIWRLRALRVRTAGYLVRWRIQSAVEIPLR